MKCNRCGHPEHRDQRCGVPITEPKTDHIGLGLLAEFVVTVGNCACGLVDQIVYEHGINVDDLGGPFPEPTA